MILEQISSLAFTIPSSTMPAATNWESLAAAHRERQLKAIPSQWLLPDDKLATLRNTGTPREGRLLESDVVRKSGLLCEKELEITERFTAAELLSKLSRQELTAEEVIVAFSKRASLAHQLVCIFVSNVTPRDH